ncbi:TPA: hypothetical protein OMS12_003683 [Klebsiella aerogenes]|nr:hypothetical protein [Klebsiella aerogenes]HCR0512022.1 hypothetical protein [Klebsiella aerogenes]
MKEENPKWPVIAIVVVFILFMTGMMCYGLIRDKREVLFHITNQFYGVNCEKSSGIAWVIKNDYRQDLTFHDYAVFCNDTGFSGKQIKTGHEIQINKDVIYNALSGNKHQK